MAERPFPPSPRRRALARQSGLSAASPLLVGALACAALVVSLGAHLGGAMAERLGAWVVAATRGESFDVAEVLVFAPPFAAMAIVAALAHVAQARAVWMPRRRIAGAPDFTPPRTELVNATVIGVVAFGWLWLAAPRLTGAEAIASALATFAIAWVVLGVLDALLRHRALALAMHMTAHEHREDQRLAAADPRWRAYRAKQRFEGATLVLAGDTTAAAIQWDPVRRPVPTCIASGPALPIVAHARRDRTPIHRDVQLAKLPLGPIAERHWARLAEIVAAVKR